MASTADGQPYVPYTIRRLTDGRQIGAHHDYHYGLSLYNELAPRLDTTTLVSFVVTLGKPDAGGELFVYGVTPQTPAPKLPNGFSWDVPAIEKEYPFERLVMDVGDVFLLGWIEPARQAGLDVAKGAGAGAHVAHDHEGGVALLPALADVGAAGLLAHRVQAVLAHDAARLGIAERPRRLYAYPRGLTQRRRLRPVRLLGMARPDRRRCKRIDQNGHAWTQSIFTYYLRGRVTRRKASVAIGARLTAAGSPAKSTGTPWRRPSR